MEKGEKNGYSLKPNEVPTEKGKRSSKLYQQNFYENEVPNSKVMMQQQVPIYQNNQYFAQQQMIPYGQPVMMNGGFPSNQYIVNQINPVPVTPLKFGVIAMTTVCPFCQVSAPTKIEESFNCCTCFCYFFIILLIPILLILSAYSGCHNVNCNNGCTCDCTCCVCGACACKCCIDVNHYCANCGKLLGTRDSCTELCPCFSKCIC